MFVYKPLQDNMFGKSEMAKELTRILNEETKDTRINAKALGYYQRHARSVNTVNAKLDGGFRHRILIDLTHHSVKHIGLSNKLSDRMKSLLVGIVRHHA